jgi:hypothetical protein
MTANTDPMKNPRRRWRKVQVYLHHHPAFRALTLRQRYVCLYVLTSGQLNRCGLCVFAASIGANDCQLPTRTFRREMVLVCDTFSWEWEPKRTQMLWIPSWWSWNAPQNPGQLSAYLHDIDLLEHGPLLDFFARTVDTLPTELLQTTFQAEMLKRGLPRG